jgi:hypothetical protein
MIRNDRLDSVSQLDARTETQARQRPQMMFNVTDIEGHRASIGI